MLKNILIVSGIILLLTLAGCGSSDSSGAIAPKNITATYTGTISGASVGDAYAADQNYTVSIVLDNNNSSLISQTWTSDDIVSITYSINNDANISTVFSPVVLTTTNGNFTTDENGTLTSVPSGWNDSGSLSTVAQTNDPYAVSGQFLFYINGVNGVYTPDNWTHWLDDANVAQDIDPAYWTISWK